MRRMMKKSKRCCSITISYNNTGKDDGYEGIHRTGRQRKATTVYAAASVLNLSLIHIYIEVNAKDLLEECEPGIRNQNVCCKAMLDAMLEGDGFIVEPKNKSKCAASLTIRYYVDNLSPERRKYAEVNQ